MHGHHLGVDGERYVGVVAAAGCFEWGERRLLRLLGLLLLRFIFLLLQLRLQVGDCWSVECTLLDAAILESPAVETGFVVVVAMANDFAAIDDDTAVLVVQRRLGGLLQAEGKISISLHFGWLVGGGLNLRCGIGVGVLETWF